VRTKIITLIIIIYSPLFAIEKSTIAVFDLQPTGISNDESVVLTNRLRSNLINIGQYIVVDRANMEEILTEQGFQQSGCTSDECVVEAGKLLGVQNMMSGSVGKIGDTYTISLQIVDMETGQITMSSIYDYQGVIENLLTEGIQTALLRLLGLAEVPVIISQNPRGYLKLKINPDASAITIDGNPYRKEELDQIELPVGFHTINITVPYFYPYTREVQITQNSLLPLDISLVSGEKDLLKTNRQNRLRIFGSILSIGSTVICATLANSTFNDYQNATIATEVEDLRQQSEMFDNVTLGFSLITVASVTYTIIKWRKVNKLKTTLGVK